MPDGVSTSISETTGARWIATMLPLNWLRELMAAMLMTFSAAWGIRVRIALANGDGTAADATARHSRSEEHTSELQSLMRSSYAVFCLKKKNTPLNALTYS